MLALMSRDVAEIAPEIAAVDTLHDADTAGKILLVPKGGNRVLEKTRGTGKIEGGR